MTRDATGVGRWREEGRSRRPARTGPTPARKWIGIAIVATLLSAAVGAFAWLAFQVWFATGPRPYFVAFWVGPYDRPEIPPTAWLDADRRALKDDRVFPGADPRSEGADEPTLEVIRKRLGDLAVRPRDEAVVVYLSAYAVVDPDKKIQILAADSIPYELKTQLPLSWVLDRLKNCPARNKLLVLDIMRGMLDPRDVGGTADGVGDLLARELQDGADPGRLNDPDLMVIAACGPGEVALGSEALRHSAFGYYFHRALTTDEADTGGDGTVSVRELAGYLARNVDAWAMHYRGLHQRPALLGRQQGDFPLASTRPSRSPAAVNRAEATDRAAEEAKAATTTAARNKGAAGEGEDKEKTKEKGSPADAGTSEPVAGPARAYPAWLAAAWATVERWRKDGDFRAAPRVYRRLARESIRAEFRWRGGEPDEAVRRDLEPTARELTMAMEQAQKISRPPPRSVGQERALGRRPDPATKAVLDGLLRLRRELPDDSPELAKAVKEGLAAFKGKGGLDLAEALVDASEDAILDAKTLAFLDGIVEQSRTVLDPSRPPRDILELRFLHQLARRAGMPGEWKPDTARIAWRTVLYAEQANSRPEAMAWVRRQLDEADASLHEARVLLLPVSEAVGYASWGQIAAAWDDAWAKYKLVGDRQRAIREGQAALSRAMAALVSLIPYLEASPTAELQADWLEAAAQGGDLARMLEPPIDQQPAAPGAVVTLDEAAGRLDGLTRKLMAPLEPTAVRTIVERCRSEMPPDPALALQTEAMLLTPFLAAADRQALHDAERTLDARLDKTWRPADLAGSSGASGSGRPGERARRRFERIAAFLKLAGDPTTARRLDEFRQTIEESSRLNPATRVDLPWDMSDPASAWSSIARVAVLAYATFDQLLRSDRPDELDRPGWMAPAYLAGFGDWASNPTRRRRERAARATWTWLAAHYRHESRDLHELLDPDGMLELAARECPTDTPGAPEVALRIDGPTSPIPLSPTRPAATVNLQLVLTGAGTGDRQKVVLDVLQPEDPRLRVAAPDPDAPEVSPTAPTPVSLELQLSDDSPRAGVPPPGGLLVRARTPDGRTYHRLVPLSIVSAGMSPRLALSRSPAESDDLPMDRLRLRPIAGLRQPFYVFVKNPSDRPWGVVVEILEGDKVVGSSGAKPMPVAAHSSMPVPGFGTPAPKPGAELREPAGPLRIRLSDAAGTVLDEQPLRPAIAAPVDYLEVTRVEFAPDAPGQPNRLTVVLRPLPELTGLPCPVELVLPMDKERFPSLRDLPKIGKLSGELKPGKAEMTLYAENLVLAPSIDAEGSFYLNVDGVERALWFRSRFPQVGATQRATESHRPRVRLDARPKFDPARLEVAFRVDEAPAGARLDVRLGQSRDGQLADDLTWRGPAKRRHLGFDPGGEGGALLFEASIKDQVWINHVPGMFGPRRLRARLLDDTGRVELGSFETDVILDDQLPRAMSIKLPERITRGAKELEVRASVTPPPSKIAEVAFIFGPKADFPKAAAENRTFPARTGDPEGREWSATLPVPADAPARLVVTARFTTGVGLTAFQSGEVAVIDRPRPEDTKPAAPRPGAITGIAKEGDRPQPGLRVYLLDPAPPPNKSPLIDHKDTDEKGAYAFTDLEPKAYRVYCIKQDGINNRFADKRVTVEPGKTIRLELELAR